MSQHRPTGKGQPARRGFAGEVALITGSSQRIGAGFARALAERGMTVAIHYRNSDAPARALAEELTELGGRGAVFAADLEDVGAAERLFAEVVEQLGAPRVLIHNASRYEPLRLAETDAAALRRELTVHLESPVALSRAFAAALPEGAEGRIVCMLDWRATLPDPAVFPYTLSKSGLWAMMRNLAVELGPHVTVNGIAPGAILPASSKTVPAETEEDLAARATGLPIDRSGRLEDVVEACCFFIDGASYTTGAVLPVDGGRHLL